MNQPIEIPLILGGHSFIRQLGNDPLASRREQLAIVESCLDHGIRWFDTTYQPERIALGDALAAVGRRSEAKILAWNFFTDFGPSDPVGEPQYYRPEHIDAILEQLRTSYVDCLVMVPLDDCEENERQKELALEWRTKGYARSLGLWIRDSATIQHNREGKPFQFAIRPFNVTTDEAAPLFAACKMAGCQTVATSPFFRGWELDRMITEASARGFGDVKGLRSAVADLMLRFSLFQSNVDRVMVAMRKVDWIAPNLASVSRGPLTDNEYRWLQRLRRLTVKKHRWWQRW